MEEYVSDESNIVIVEKAKIVIKLYYRYRYPRLDLDRKVIETK